MKTIRLPDGLRFLTISLLAHLVIGRILFNKFTNFKNFLVARSVGPGFEMEDVLWVTPFAQVPRKASIPLKTPVLKMSDSAKQKWPHKKGSQGRSDFQLSQSSQPSQANTPSNLEDLPMPSYPFLSRKFKEQGSVLLKASDSPASTIELSKSSGFERLDQAALTHFRQLRSQGQSGLANEFRVTFKLSK